MNKVNLHTYCTPVPGNNTLAVVLVKLCDYLNEHFILLLIISFTQLSLGYDYACTAKLRMQVTSKRFAKLNGVLVHQLLKLSTLHYGGSTI
jgi:hypothetical protein